MTVKIVTSKEPKMLVALTDSQWQIVEKSIELYAAVSRWGDQGDDPSQIEDTGFTIYEELSESRATLREWGVL